MSETSRLVAVAIAFTLLGVTIAGIANYGIPGITTGGQAIQAPQTREFFLDIKPADIPMGAGAVWHAWTYNGTVPGPTLTATVGDVIRVTVHNSMNSTHSFHTHLSPYSLASDGSQLNSITGIGGMAMIPAGQNYTYEFLANVPGLFYYHDHSADGGHTIHEHIAQGLYGAIIIKAINEAPVDDQVVFMSERGFDVNKPDAPFYIMNGHGLPGGEHALEGIFAAKGVPGVVAQVGTTVPALVGRVGVPIRINVINIGDVVHTFHLHGMTAYLDDGKPLPAQVAGLDPGEVIRLTVTPTEAGLWLFHCHVVSHADAGMIGIFVVQPATGDLNLPAPDPSALDMPASDMGGMDMGGSGSSAGSYNVTAGAGGNELSFTPASLALPGPGTYTIHFHNAGKAQHAFAIPSLGIDTHAIAPGASVDVTVRLAKSGSYEFICSEPGHADAGMKGTITA